MSEKERNRLIKHVYVMILAGILVSTTSHARELVDNTLGFRITIPDEYQDFPAGKNRPVVLYSFLRPSPTGEKNVNIVIESMNRTIVREPMPAKALESVRAMFPEGSTASICRRKWKGYTVEGVEGIIPYGKIKVISRQVQIPLRRDAIQITVAGPETADQEIAEALDRLLISLQGESNWDLEPGRKLGTGERIVSGVKALFWLAVTIAIAALIAKAITSAFRKKKDGTSET